MPPQVSVPQLVAHLVAYGLAGVVLWRLCRGAASTRLAASPQLSATTLGLALVWATQALPLWSLHYSLLQPTLLADCAGVLLSQAAIALYLTITARASREGPAPAASLRQRIPGNPYPHRPPQLVLLRGDDEPAQGDGRWQVEPPPVSLRLVA